MLAITFWEWREGRPYPVPITEVALSYGVDPWTLHELFEEWAEADHPEIHRLQLGEKRYLELYRYQEGVRGWLRLVRPWGTHWRLLPGPTWFFTLEVAV